MPLPERPVHFQPVASKPIIWAGQSPGAPKVLGAPRNFADLKNYKTTSTMTCMKAVFHDI